MKTTLDDASRKELVQYRLSRAQETLNEAEYNANGGYYNAAVNRLYYACYYAASALMLSANLDASTHQFDELMPQAEDFVRRIESMI